MWQDAEKLFMCIPSHKPHVMVLVIMSILELKKQRPREVEASPGSYGH